MVSKSHTKGKVGGDNGSASKPSYYGPQRGTENSYHCTFCDRRGHTSNRCFCNPDAGSYYKGGEKKSSAKAVSWRKSGECRDCTWDDREEYHTYYATNITADYEYIQPNDHDHIDLAELPHVISSIGTVI